MLAPLTFDFWLQSSAVTCPRMVAYVFCLVFLLVVSERDGGSVNFILTELEVSHFSSVLKLPHLPLCF